MKLTLPTSKRYHESPREQGGSKSRSLLMKDIDPRETIKYNDISSIDYPHLHSPDHIQYMDKK